MRLPSHENRTHTSDLRRRARALPAPARASIPRIYTARSTRGNYEKADGADPRCHALKKKGCDEHKGLAGAARELCEDVSALEHKRGDEFPLVRPERRDAEDFEDF